MRDDCKGPNSRRMSLQGLDEALLSMSTGSIRRLYIPGDLAFPKGLASAPGRHGSHPTDHSCFRTWAASTCYFSALHPDFHSWPCLRMTLR